LQSRGEDGADDVSKRPDLRYERRFWKSGLAAIAGVDEAGVGPMAGPVVAAAVIFEPETFIKGVHDSKQLTPEQREELFPLISAKAITVGVGVAGHAEVDELNIYWASMLASERALAALTQRPDHVLVDGRLIPNLKLPQTKIVGGDRKSFCIAAASIIAKVTRDRMMAVLHDEHPHFGWLTNKGYGTPEHLFALSQFGPTTHHRRSFAPVHNILYGANLEDSTLTL
jgi:ribonuclease HII